MAETPQGAPAPAPVPTGSNADMSRSTAQEAVTTRLYDGMTAQQIDLMVQTRVNEALAKGVKPEVINVNDEIELQQILSGVPGGSRALTEKQKLLLAHACDSANLHGASRALRGKKDTFFEKTMSMGKTSISINDVLVFTAGGIIVWAVYELIASKMDWSFRVGIWDPPSRR